MRARYILVLFILFCCRVASAQPAAILHQPYGVQQRYVDSLFKSTGNLEVPKRLEILRMFAGWAQNNKDYPLSAALRIKEYMLDIYNQKGESYQLEQNILAIIVEAKDKDLTAIQADALQAMGNYWVRLHKYSLAFENFKAAYDIYSKLSPQDFPNKQGYLFEYGGIYYRYEDNLNALACLKEALAISPSTHELYNTINNTIGLCYRRLKQYDSAEHYFIRVYNNTPKNANDPWEGIASGNIGITYFYKKKYDEAIPLIEKDMNMGFVTRQLKSSAGAMHMLSRIYYERKEYAKAEDILTKALKMCQTETEWPDYEMAELLYRQLYKVYAAENKMPLAYLYADSALMAKDTNAVRHNAESLARARERVEFVHKKLEAEQIAGQRTAQLIIRNSLIAAIVLLSVIGIMFINRQRLRQKKLLAEKAIAEKELDHAAAQLETFRKSVQEKNNMLEQFAAEIEKIKQGQSEQTDTELLTQLEQATILTDEQWEHFRLMFEKVHKGFFTNLKKKIPDLTPSEVRFLALTKLRLSSKEMASMLGISTNAIRLYRHRLRKKLDLDKEDMIEELVNNL